MRGSLSTVASPHTRTNNGSTFWWQSFFTEGKKQKKKTRQRGQADPLSSVTLCTPAASQWRTMGTKGASARLSPDSPQRIGPRRTRSPLWAARESAARRRADHAYAQAESRLHSHPGARRQGLLENKSLLHPTYGEYSFGVNIERSVHSAYSSDTSPSVAAAKSTKKPDAHVRHLNPTRK